VCLVAAGVSLKHIALSLTYSYSHPTNSYDLSLVPDLAHFTFTGTVVIAFTVDGGQLTDDALAKSITLHSKELTYVSASYTSDASPTMAVSAQEIRVNFKATTVQFVFGTSIPPTATTLQLTIHYTGFLNNQMAGFYRSSYRDINGDAQIMASTQFESLDARRAFPCVDEPSAKATFVVALTIPRNRQALSNMPASSVVQLSASQQKVTFLPTPKMSTYLLAFLVAEVDAVSALSASGTLVTVYTPPGQSAAGTFALDTACRSLEAYNDFFGVPYPLPKLDMVAIPEFAAGAMGTLLLIGLRGLLSLVAVLCI
jgi:aminopeptidase N